MKGKSDTSKMYIDTELEDCVIGEMLIDGVDEAFECGIQEEYFTQENASDVFCAIRLLHECGAAVDLLTLFSHLRETGKLDRLKEYVLNCTAKIYTSVNIAYHIEALSQLYLKRETCRFGLEIRNAVTVDRQEELLSELQTLTENLMAKKYTGSNRELSYYLDKSKEAYDKRVELRKDGRIAGITSGIFSLDKMLTGWHNSELIIVAGRPGMGKTAVAVHFALSAAKEGRNVLFYTLEMSGHTLTDRMIMAVSDMDATDYREGVTREDSNAQMNAARKELEQRRIYIDDTPLVTTNYIRSSAKRMKKGGMCDLVIIDYLQLIDMNTGVNKQYNREQQVAKTSRELKLLAKELDVPVICLSQLSRSVEGRQDKMPVMSDLRDSGSIEQDADVIIFVYRPDYYEKDTDRPKTNTAVLKVAKQREGNTGQVSIVHNSSLTKIQDSSYNVNYKPFEKESGFTPNNIEYEQEVFPF